MPRTQIFAQILFHLRRSCENDSSIKGQETCRSRLNFIFAGAVFSAVYLVRFNELEISLLGFVILYRAVLDILLHA